MTTFAEFQEYYLREIWRTGDSDLTTDLPRLIKKAEARIKRDLREQSLVTTYTGTITSGSSLPLPADFSELISVNLGNRKISMCSYPDLYRSEYDSQRGLRGPAAILGDRLYFRGILAEGDTYNSSLTYYMGLVPYETDPEIPFYDKHPDFYVAALNIYVYEYLREFDLKGQNDQNYLDLLDSMTRNSNYARWPSGNLTNPMFAAATLPDEWGDSPVTPSPEPEPTDYVAIYQGSQ